MRGWNAIEAALRARYGDLEPETFGTLRRYDEGGPDPLDGISAYFVDGPVPHWHFVSFGLSELYEKESDQARSGWGFELSFRIASEPGSELPQWALTFLQRLARYVFVQKRTFAPGDHIDYGDPLDGRPDCAITALAFAKDPELGSITTPNGPLTFVIAYGLTRVERPMSVSARADLVMAKVAQTNPLFVTDVTRR